jgi:hypothetical protein
MISKLGGSCEKRMVVGEIELRMGAGRALPQSGFSGLHPGSRKRRTTHGLRRMIRQEESMNGESETTTGLSHLYCSEDRHMYQARQIVSLEEIRISFAIESSFRPLVAPRELSRPTGELTGRS